VTFLVVEIHLLADADLRPRRRLMLLHVAFTMILSFIFAGYSSGGCGAFSILFLLLLLYLNGRQLYQ
jgi:hypothetical protein